MPNLYAYPCEDPCYEFLVSGTEMSFAEFCETHCGGGCPDCVYMDIPYTDEMKKV